MPLVVVLLLMAFYGAGVLLLAVPVSPARLQRFIARYSLECSDANLARLHSYLAARRRLRVAGVLAAATVGLMQSIPDNRFDFGYVTLLLGWFLGAIAAEIAQRGGGARLAQPASLPYWWGPIPTATAVVALLWTAAAVFSRGEGVPFQTVTAWGAGALATALALRAVVRHVSRQALRGLCPPDAWLASVTSVDAARSLTVGGTALAALCLGRLWDAAVPGPYAEPLEISGAVWLAAVVMLALAMIAARPSPARSQDGSAETAQSPGKPGRRGMMWLAYVVVAVLPIAWAVPVRLAQVAPIGPHEVQASARIRIARLDLLHAAQAELGLKVDGRIGAPPTQQLELIGRLDVARPAPQGADYQMFAFDRRTRAALPVYGANGGSWYGHWTSVLPERYPWLANVVGIRDATGLRHDPMATGHDPESGVLWFRSGTGHDGGLAHYDVQLVLMLIRQHDSYIYWAAMVPSTSSDVYR